MLTAMMAGWVFAVCRSSSSGPSKMSCKRPPPRAASTSSRTARASGYASASALPIPTACDPWPGNTNATGMLCSSGCCATGDGPPRADPDRLSPADEGAAPGHPAADGHHQDEIAILETPRPVRLIERERHRCRRGIANLLDVHLALLQRDFQLLHDVLEDAEVRLVRDAPGHVARRAAVRLQRLPRRA